MITRHISNRLKQTVDEIKEDKNCKVADILMQSFHNENLINPKNKQNFIDIRSSEKMISFLDGKQADEYASIWSGGRWSRENRKTIKIGRFVRNWISPESLKTVKDHEIAKFSAYFESHFSSHIKLELVSCHDSYKSKNHFENLDYGSCMMDEPVGDFYDRIGVQSLVAIDTKNDNKFLGRALLWHNVMSEDETMTFSFIDRLYYRDAVVLELFKAYAKENGYYFRESFDDDTGYISLLKGDEVSSEMLIKWYIPISISDIPFYPFLDTFRYGNDNYLTSYSDYETVWEYSACSGIRVCVDENDEDVYENDEDSEY